MSTSEKRYVTIDDIRNINTRMIGWKGIDEADQEYFVKNMNNLICKDKWNIADLEYLNTAINLVNSRPHLDYIFLILNNHPQWTEYYGRLVRILPEKTILKLRKEIRNRT